MLSQSELESIAAGGKNRPSTISSPHPAVIVGYGAYGLTVMRRLLTSASPHGLLRWEHDEAGDTPGARRLKDLQLIWVPEPSDRPAAGEGHLIKDLYSQILEIRGSDSSAHLLTAAMVNAKDRLIAAERALADPHRPRPGLDVFVVAQPNRVELLGMMQETLQPALDALARDPTLRTQASGADLLNLTAFLDFDQYRANRQLNVEVHAWVLRWKQRVKPDQPGFGRIYFSDGQTRAGRRTESLRVEETVLFLEFLLFAEMRAEPALRRLYQPLDSNDVEPLSAMGIRVIERSWELLSRLAAAKFACGWLRFMAGRSAPDTVEAQALIRSKLAAYQPERLDLTEERRELNQIMVDNVRHIQDGLIEFTREHAEDPNWPGEIRQRAARAIFELRARVAHWAGDRASQIIRSRLGDLQRDLRKAITEILHADVNASPLGLMIEEVSNLRHSLNTPETRPQSAPPDLEDFSRIEQIHSRYMRFRSLQASPSGLASNLWPLLAIVFACAWTPVLVTATRELPKPAFSASFIVRTGYDTVQGFGQYWVAGLFLLGMAWLVGRLVLHRAVERRIQQAAQVYLNPERGELTDAIRRTVASEQFESSISSYTDEVFDAMVRRVRSEIQRELSIAIRLLRKRGAEMDWLRLQLSEFLRTHGIDADDPQPSLGRSRVNVNAPSPRLSMLQDGDFRTALRRHPNEDSGYQRMQSTQKPFANWHLPYSNPFLYPIAFLDSLSREYQESPDGEILAPNTDQERQRRAAELIRSISDYGSFPVGVDWKEHVVQSFCVIPELWNQLPDVANALSERAYIPQAVIQTRGGDRVYLIQVQLGVNPEVLLPS